MLVNINECIKLLLDGKVVGIPTDTIYGLASLDFSIDELYKIKKRDKNKKIIRFIPNISYLKETDEVLLIEMKKNWPGKVTYIYKVDGEFESFRIPDEKNVLKLLEDIQKELYVTSANISGEQPCLTEDEFIKKFPEIPVLEKKIDCESSNTPSKIYMYKNNKFERIR